MRRGESEGRGGEVEYAGLLVRFFAFLFLLGGLWVFVRRSGFSDGVWDTGKTSRLGRVLLRRIDSKIMIVY
jgi:hypothetical protein